MSDRPRLPRTPGEALRGFFKHPSPIVLSVFAVGFTVARVAMGNWTWYDAIAPAVLLVGWPVYEWMIHVFVLHYRPIQLGKRKLDLRVARIHREHHAYPWDLPLSFIPFHVVPVTGIPMIAAAYLIAPSAALATGFIAAYLWLSLHYEWCHYLAHIDWAPPLDYYRRRIRLHRLHHFHHERLWWGVSTGWGDTVLRTGPDLKDAPRSKFTHDLLGAPSSKPVRVRR